MKMSDDRRLVIVPEVDGNTIRPEIVMPALKEALLAAEEAGRFTVTAVSDCGPQELCFRGAEALPEDAPYMTTVIVKDREA